MYPVQDTLDRIVPEGHHYRHLDEGLDDMPAHVKVIPCSPFSNLKDPANLSSGCSSHTLQDFWLEVKETQVSTYRFLPELEALFQPGICCDLGDFTWY